jgi:hypothetical protein
MKVKYRPPKDINDITIFDTRCMELRAKIDASRELYRAISVKRFNLKRSQDLRARVNDEIIELFGQLTKEATIYRILTTVGMKYKNVLYPLKKKLKNK